MKNTLLTLALLAAVPVIANENAVQENTDSVEVAALPAAPDAQATDAVDCPAQITDAGANTAPTEQQPEITEEEFKKLIEDLIEKTKQEEEAKKTAQAAATAQ